MTVMYAASRDALAHIRSLAEDLIRQSEQSVVLGQQMGAELFTVVEIIEKDRPTRIAVADVSATPQQRRTLMTSLIENKVLPETLRVCQVAAGLDWSNQADLRDGLVRTARSALLQAAELSNSLPQVEEELFQLSRTIKAHPGLEQALGDRRASADERRALLAQLLYGKVSAISEILASQAVARPQEGLAADDLDILSRQAAHEIGRRVADVTTPIALNDAQREALRKKLHGIYGIEVSIHEVINPAILGGVIIKVGSGIINGSLASKLDSLRRSLV